MDEHNAQESEKLEEVLRSLTDRPAEDHPDIEELLHFQLGELDPKRNEALTQHVALCVQCTEALADLEAFPDLDLAPGETPASNDEVQELWRTVEGQIATSEKAASESRSTSHRTLQATPWSSLLWLRAASIVLLASSLTFGSLWWQSMDSGIHSPVLTSETVILRSVEGSPQRDGAEAPRLGDVPTDVVNLNFPVSGTEGFDAFEAILLDANDQLVLETGAFSKHQSLVTVAVRRDALPPGLTQITLYGLTDGPRVSIGTYVLVRVEDETP